MLRNVPRWLRLCELDSQKSNEHKVIFERIISFLVQKWLWFTNVITFWCLILRLRWTVYLNSLLQMLFFFLLFYLNSFTFLNKIFSVQMDPLKIAARSSVRCLLFDVVCIFFSPFQPAFIFLFQICTSCFCSWFVPLLFLFLFFCKMFWDPPYFLTYCASSFLYLQPAFIFLFQICTSCFFSWFVTLLFLFFFFCKMFWGPPFFLTQCASFFSISNQCLCFFFKFTHVAFAVSFRLFSFLSFSSARCLRSSLFLNIVYIFFSLSPTSIQFLLSNFHILLLQLVSDSPLSFLSLLQDVLRSLFFSTQCASSFLYLQQVFSVLSQISTSCFYSWFLTLLFPLFSSAGCFNVLPVSRHSVHILFFICWCSSFKFPHLACAVGFWLSLFLSFFKHSVSISIFTWLYFSFYFPRFICCTLFVFALPHLISLLSLPRLRTVPCVF